MEVTGMKAQRQTRSEADVYKLKNAVNQASTGLKCMACLPHTSHLVDSQVFLDPAIKWPMLVLSK